MLRTSWITALSCAAIVACADVPVAPDAEEGPDIALSHSGSGGSSIDQSQPVADAVAPFTFAIGGASNQLLAQTFTAGVTGKLREVEVPVACADGELLLDIRDVTPAGTPGAVLFGPFNFRVFMLTPFTPGVATFNILATRPSPDLSAGVQYAFVLSNPTGSCGMLPGPVGDPYAAGDGWFFDNVNGQWVDLALGNSREDLAFFTYMK